MALSADLHSNSQYIIFLPTLTIGSAITATTTPVVTKLGGMKYLVVFANFLYGAGGTTVDAYVQTSLDGGVSWADIAQFNFTTAAAKKINALTVSTALAAVTAPSDGALASNTIVSGLLGDRLRLKYTSAGTYTGATSLTVTGMAKG